MELTVAANYDLAAVAELAKHPVTEVYGKFAADLVGGGRPSYMGTPLTPRQLQIYVDALRDHGIAFNYLLNSSCLGNQEWSRRFQRRFLRLLDRLLGMGIRRLTVSTPFLLERIKCARPEFRVKAGIYAQIDTPRRARFWQELGADALNLESFSINRDFARLRAIRDAVECELVLIANHPCLPNCPLQPYHQNLFAHASDGSRQLMIDYCFLRCTAERIRDLSLFLKSQWIRPEDIHLYEAMGYNTFKLIERDMPTPDLLARVAAYSSRRSPANLADLILPYGFRQTKNRSRFWLLKHFFRPWQIAPWRLRPLYEVVRRHGMLFALEKRPVIIHSDRLPTDFAEVVGGTDCLGDACTSCHYCDRIAKGAVEIDPQARDQLLAELERTLDQLTSGALWHV